MKPIEFDGQNAEFAKNQIEYINLPARLEDGVVTTCWSLSWRERLQVLFRGVVWLRVLTWDKPLQPLQMMTERPYTEEAPDA